jgi:hypothetical protein
VSANAPDALETLIHDVRSQGSNLISAAALLRESTAGEARELLELMTRQAQELAAKLAAYRRSLGS